MRGAVSLFVYWSGLSLAPQLKEVLESRFAGGPLAIQRAALPVVASGVDCVIHSETGSGKTYSWALALLDRRCVVLAPSEALCAQLRRECVAVGAKNVGDSSTLGDIIGGGLVGMAIATPEDALAAFEGSSQIGGEDALCVVLDEADALLRPLGKYASFATKSARDGEKSQPASALVRKLVRLRPKTQLVAASATVGRPLRREIDAMLRESSTTREPITIVRAISDDDPKPEANKRFVTAPAGIRHLLAEVPDDDEERRPSTVELRALLRTMKAFEGKRTLVVAAERGASPERVMKALQAAGYETASLRDLRDNDERSQGGPHPIVVAKATSIRGIDLDELDSVVVLGRPRTSDEYLHVSGRTGRAGRKGTVLTLATRSNLKIVQSWSNQLDLQFKLVKL